MNTQSVEFTFDLDTEVYNRLADILYYPEDDIKEKTNKVQQLLDKKYSNAASELEIFTGFINNSTKTEQEELFTRSFDVQAVTTIDIGYVLFGDDYKRGELLVNLNREHKDAGNDCGTELSDHLPNVLRLLPKMKDKEIRNEFVAKIIIPGLKKIIGEFEIIKREKKDKVYEKHHRTIIERSDDYWSIYKKPLQAILAVIEKDFEFLHAENEDFSSGFAKSVKTELEID